MNGHPVVAIARQLHPAGAEPLRERFELREGGLQAGRELVLSLVKGADALVADSTIAVDEELLRAAGPQLRVVANLAVGHDNVDLDTLAAPPGRLSRIHQTS